MTQHLPVGRLTHGDKPRRRGPMCASDVARGGLYALPPNALILNAKFVEVRVFDLEHIVTKVFKA